MPCTNPTHSHIWPGSGNLVIQRCETRCGLCVGLAARKDWRHAWFLRRHAETHLRNGEYPDLIIDSGWDIRNPTGVGFNTKRRAKQRALKRARRKWSASPSSAGDGPIERGDDMSSGDERVEQSNDLALDTHSDDACATLSVISAPVLDAPNQDTLGTKLECLLFPPELGLSDSVYQNCFGTLGGDTADDDLGDDLECDQHTTNDSDNDEISHEDVVNTLQAIASGETTGSHLPRVMGQYICDVLGQERLRNIMSRSAIRKLPLGLECSLTPPSVHETFDAITLGRDLASTFCNVLESSTNPVEGSPVYHPDTSMPHSMTTSPAVYRHSTLTGHFSVAEPSWGFPPLDTSSTTDLQIVPDFHMASARFDQLDSGYKPTPGEMQRMYDSTYSSFSDNEPRVSSFIDCKDDEHLLRHLSFASEMDSPSDYIDNRLIVHKNHRGPTEVIDPVISTYTPMLDDPDWLHMASTVSGHH